MRVAALLGFVLPVLLACGSPIVGAECKRGFTICDGRCVSLDDDPEHCGACDNDCGRFVCNAGACGTSLRPDLDGGEGRDGGASEPTDAGLVEGGTDGRPVPTGSRGGAGTPFTPDGGLAFPDGAVGAGCELGELQCASTCVDPRLDRDHCGACLTPCSSDQFCVDGACVDACDAPLSLCGELCVDLQQNEGHCGSCNRSCASGICESGACADLVPGHVVVIGHDYRTSASLAMRRIAGNALFLASGAPVRALVYAGKAQPASLSGVTQAIDAVVALDGRSWTPIDVDPAQLGVQLRDADALLIHAQAGASDAELTDLGEQWGLSLAQFLLRGGVIVLFETTSANNAGTHRLLEPAGLFGASGIEAVSRQNLRVVAPGIGVAARVTLSYPATATTVHFLGLDSPGTVVVEDRDGEPVVVHRVIAP